MRTAIASGGLKNTVATLQADDTAAEVLKVAEAGSASAITASSQMKSGAGSVVGFIVSSQGAADTTIKIWDSLSATGTVLLDTMAIGVAVYVPFPAKFTTGCYVTLAGTTPAVTVVYN